MHMNRKVAGATPTVYNGIQFKSKREAECYKLLDDSKYTFSYESSTYELSGSVKLSKVSVYGPKISASGSASKDIYQTSGLLRSVTYTPDFTVYRHDVHYIIFIEVKGYRSPSYAVKKKLFLKRLNETDKGYNYLFFEVYSTTHMKQVLKIIDNL